MTTVLHLAAVISIVFAMNLLPAFAPPTWAVLVFVRFQWPDVPTPALIAGGALAASAGRLALAASTRKLTGRLSSERRTNLQTLGRALAKRKAGVLASLVIFVFSPLPSAQLFMAAGLADLPLLPLSGAFLVGRSISYTVYLTAASAADQTVRRLLSEGFTSPSAIAIQVASLAAVIAMIKVDWIKTIDWARAHLTRPSDKPRSASISSPNTDSRDRETNRT